jgi:hypothetical protein
MCRLPATLFFRNVLFCFVGILALAASACADSGAPVHGLWIWKTSSVLAVPGSSESLRDFCSSEQITEVYVSFSHNNKAEVASVDAILAGMIRTLHKSGIRVEALLSSADADQPGKHRDKLLDHIRDVLEFNERHASDRFDGVHLDIEPQQRPENKGAGNLRFLPDLVETFRAARRLTSSAHLTLNADIQNKLLKGDLDQRRGLLTSLPRLTLMLYELNSPGDGTTAEQKAEKLRSESQNFIAMAYQGLDDPNLAKMTIGLRTPDYEELMPRMLKTVDAALHSNPHYLGWAWHSWNDSAKANGSGN